ncbi:MAG TPA: DUF1573 domain-containing protein [Ohtaekwangia sp.]|nr:DUF1573 domain-containing protein [Ohtaekwangia sp.]
MKTAVAKTLFLFSVVLVCFTACKDRNAEKRIAELESRLKEIEGKKPAGQTAVQAAEAAEEKPEGPLPVIQFESTEHDFGTIREGDPAEHTYAFKNTGEAPLIIQKAEPSCGCTVPDYSKEPVPVGGTGFIKVKFDSNGKTNMINKSVTVTANTFPKQTVLKFKAMVTPKAGSGPAK